MHRLYLKNLLEILNAVFAQRTFEIGWEGFAFVDIAAHLAHPTAFAVFGLLWLWLWFGFYVLLVIIVGKGRLVGKHLGIQHVGDEHGVRAEVDTLGDTASQVGIGVFRNIEHVVDGAMLALAVGELIHLASRLETEMLEDLHRCLCGQHTDVEHTRVLDEVVGVVALVDGNGHLQGVTRDLNHRVHDAAVVDVVVIGGKDIKSITNIE